MSRRNDFAALQQIRKWNVDTVVRCLEKNGLVDCASAVKKRGITGDNFLDLTEIKLATWKRDLNIMNIRKLTAFIQELNKDPTQYLLPNNEAIDNPPVTLPLGMKESINPASLKGLLPSRSGSSSSRSSWGSDFDDDLEDGHPVKENGVKKGGAEPEPPKVHPEPTVPAHISPITKARPRPPVMKLTIPEAFAKKPAVTAAKPKVPVKFSDQLKSSPSPAPVTAEQPPDQKKLPLNTVSRPLAPVRPLPAVPSLALPPEKPNLPKPPPNMQGIVNVENLISNLNLNLCEDEYYDTFDRDSYPEIETTPSVADPPTHLETKVFGNKVKANIMNLGTKLLFPPMGPKPTSVVPSPPVEQEEEYEVCEQRPSENGYESEEYESIREQDNNTMPDGSDYYLQPVSKPVQIPVPRVTPPPAASPELLARPPPLPAKPLPLLPDVVTSPNFRPPSPPLKTKSEDSGSSGDGVTGRIGGLFRSKKEVKEKTPTPEIKKTVTPPVPSHKPPPPPPVEQRPTPVSSTQGRPLPQPPVSESSQRSLDKASGSSQRRSDPQTPLTSMPWYHNVDRRKGDAMLRNREDGTFMIRPSTQTKNPLTLTLWYNGRVYNISVRQRPDGRYALGTEKANEQCFPSIEELVINYQSEKLLLYSGGEQTGSTLLTTTPRKETSK